MKQKQAVAKKNDFCGVQTVSLILLQMLLLVYCFSAGHIRRGEHLVNIGLVVITLLLNMMLIVTKNVQKLREQLEIQLRNQELMDEVHRKGMLEKEEKQEKARRQKAALRMRLEAAQEEVKRLEHEPARLCMDAITEQNEKISEENDYCANVIVNILLKTKAKECLDKDICFDADVNIPVKSKVSDYHLCSIFANIIDNAMEACTALPKEKRKISVKSGISGSYLCIRIENPCTPEHAARPRRKGHGLGLKIVAQIAQEYGGDFFAGIVGDMFVTEVVVKVV